MVKANLGPLDGVAYTTPGELEVRENVHDVLHQHHDMSLTIFRDVASDAPDPACSFKDVTRVGFCAERGRVADVRAVVGQDVAMLGPAPPQLCGGAAVLREACDPHSAR